MKVLLLQDVKKVGKKHEVKEVSDGYARNFLLSKKLAVIADAGAMKLKAGTEAKEKELVERYQNFSKKLAKETLVFKVKSGTRGEVFGSVKAEQIQQALQEKGFDGAEPELDKPIKSSGQHEVPIKFPRGITSKVLVVIEPQP